MADSNDEVHKEELAIRAKIKKEEAAHDNRMAKERRELVNEGSAAVDKKFKALEFLLSQSKVSQVVMCILSVVC